mmetsp:Transcript_11446/g.19617  ORF Transcript_11446/g.19617 Transcript_11446/m.19617 type:complete len:315 (+) Transcript_11446:1952-2896(+)
MTSGCYCCCRRTKHTMCARSLLVSNIFALCRTHRVIHHVLIQNGCLHLYSAEIARRCIDIHSSPGNPRDSLARGANRSVDICGRCGDPRSHRHDGHCLHRWYCMGSNQRQWRSCRNCNYARDLLLVGSGCCSNSRSAKCCIHRTTCNGNGDIIRHSTRWRKANHVLFHVTIVCTSGIAGEALDEICIIVLFKEDVSGVQIYLSQCFDRYNQFPDHPGLHRISISIQFYSIQYELDNRRYLNSKLGSPQPHQGNIQRSNALLLSPIRHTLTFRFFPVKDPITMHISEYLLELRGESHETLPPEAIEQERILLLMC